MQHAECRDKLFILHSAFCILGREYAAHRRNEGGLPETQGVYCSHNNGGRLSRAAIAWASAELLLSATCHGAGLLDGVGYRIEPTGAKGHCTRRRRLNPHELGKPDDTRPLPSEELITYRVRQREPALGGGLPNRYIHRQ